MNLRLLPFLLLLPTLLFAQKAWVADNGTKYPIDAKEAVLMDVFPKLTIDTAAVAAYLLQTIPNLQPEGSGLKLEHATKSPKGLHLVFSQTFGARKVFRGSVKVNLRADGQVLSIFDHTFVLPENIDTVFPPHDVFHEGLMVHYNHPENGTLERYILEETYFFDGEALLPTIRLEVIEKQDRYYEMVLNKAVRVIYQNDLITYFSPAPQDSVVTVWVFNPDPITSSQEVYGVPYSDQNDQDVSVVNAQRVPRQVAATFASGMFSLKNSAAEIVEFSDPITTASSSSANEFNYTRTQNGFEDCNVLYHLTTMRNYIHSLGFNDLMDYAIHVDAHALNGSDNSNFNQGFNPPRLSFGEGGVDDAEDADVVVHEYGHAIMHSASPGSNSGTERRAMDEAIGDYFASSYSRSLSTFGWADVFNWDGHNEFWDGRSTVSTDHYPENLQQNIYTDADIWSATLMQIWGDIGREATDAIMLQAAYSFTSGMTMPQAAVAFIQADTLLFDAAHFSPIRQRMFDRGLIPWNVGVEDLNAQKPGSFRLLGSADFASSNGSAVVAGKAPFSIELVDALGKTLRTANSTVDKFTVSSDGLSAGVYILTVRSTDATQSFKVVKN